MAKRRVYIGNIMGPQGPGLTSTAGNPDGSWTFTYEDGRTETVSNQAYIDMKNELNTKASEDYVEGRLTDYGMYNDEVFATKTEIEGKTSKEYVDNNFAGALKGNATGRIAVLNDVSGTEHTVDTKLRAVVPGDSVNGITTYAIGNDLWKGERTYTITGTASQQNIFTDTTAYDTPMYFRYHMKAKGVVSSAIGVMLKIQYNNSADHTIQIVKEFTVTGSYSAAVPVPEGDSIKKIEMIKLSGFSEGSVELSNIFMSTGAQVEYTSTNGVVKGVKSIAPTMYLFTDTEGIIVDATYNTDIGGRFNSERVISDEKYVSKADAVTKAYVDEKDALALKKANDHSDAQDVLTANKAYQYSDEQDAITLQSAKEYTDSGDADTLQSAKAYTDSETANTKIYIDTADDRVLADAKEYADSLTDVLNVTIEDDGFGGYIADYNDNEINNARNSGKVVQAKYYDGTQTYTYYYSTMESDRRPTFIRTYVEGGVTKQVLATVGYDSKVEVVRRETDVDRAYVDEHDATTLSSAKSYADSKDVATLTSANTHTDNAVDALATHVDEQDASTLASAKSYTDTKVSDKATTAYVDAKDTETLSSAKSYTDNAVKDKATTEYVDDGDTATLKSAKTYTDSAVETTKSYVDEKDTATLTSAKEYADTAVSDKATTSYVDTKDAETLSNAKSYTDTSVAKKADKTYVDDTFATKDDTYTKGYIDGHFASAIKPTVSGNPLILDDTDDRPAISVQIDGTTTQSPIRHLTAPVITAGKVTGGQTAPTRLISDTITDFSGVTVTVKQGDTAVATYTPQADGTVLNVQTIDGNMTVLSDTEGVDVDMIIPEPIVNAEVSEVQDTGANLLLYPYYDSTKTDGGVTYTDNGDGTISVNGKTTGFSSFTFVNRLKINREVYYLSGTEEATNLLFAVSIYHNDEMIKYKVGKNLVLNFKNEYPTATEINVQVKRSNDNIITTGVLKPILSYGKVMPYEPFKGFIQSLSQRYSLSKWDRIFKDETGWKLFKGGVKRLFSSEDGWGKSGSYFWTQPKDRLSDGVEDSPVFCSIYNYKETSEEDLIVRTQIGAGEIYVKDLRFNGDLNAFKENLLRNNVSVAYRLKTPTITPLPQEDADILDRIATYYPNTVVQTDGGVITLKYVADLLNYIDGRYVQSTEHTDAQVMSLRADTDDKIADVQALALER